MKFKQFLIESDPSDADLKKIIKFVNPKYLDMFINSPYDANEVRDPLIFRGVGLEYGKLKIRNHPEGRKSANTTNEFTLLVDNFLPSWKPFPLRSESFICTTNVNTAEAYGESYYVLPFGNPNIAVCSTNDIWHSFKNIAELDEGASHVPAINEAMHLIAQCVDPDTKIGYNKESYSVTGINTLAEMKKFVNDVELLVKDPTRLKITLSKLSKDSQDDSTSGIALEIIHRSKKEYGFIKGLDSLLNPKDNKFDLISIEKFVNKKLSDNEVWFSSQAAFIYTDCQDTKDRLKKLRK